MIKHKKSTQDKLARNRAKNPNRKSNQIRSSNFDQNNKKRTLRKNKIGSSGSGKGPNGQFWLYGNHAVESALANPRRKKYRLLVNKDLIGSYNIDNIEVQPEFVSLQEIQNQLPQNAVHQGYALLVAPLKHESIETICNRSTNKSIILILDQINDPRNIGAIMRSASAFGASAIITTDRHIPDTGAWLAKTASGAVDRLPMVKVANLVRAISILKDAGFWMVGLDANASTTLAEANLTGKLAIILGSEGNGLRRLTSNHCDYLVNIPINSVANSLNVSAAAAIALYEIMRNRS